MSDCVVGDAVADVDLEGGQGGVPVVGAAPLGLGADDREVDPLAGGVLGRELTARLDDLAHLAVERLDHVGNRYERRQVPSVPMDRPGLPRASGVVSTVRPSGT